MQATLAPGEPFDHGTFEIVVESIESTEAGPTTIPAPPMDASHHEALQGPR